MAMRDPCRNPERGDKVKVSAEEGGYTRFWTVESVERHPGKVLVHVIRRTDEHGTSNIDRGFTLPLDAWRTHTEDAQVLVNSTILEAFDKE